jgi:hypothetical protein
MKEHSDKVGGLDRGDADVGRRGVYYVSDSALRRFYAG